MNDTYFITGVSSDLPIDYLDHMTGININITGWNRM